MPSIFDTIFGRNPQSPQQVAMPGQPPPIVPPQPAPLTPSMLNPLLDDTPSARDTLIGLSQGLIAAGAPTTMPMDAWSTFGKAIGGATSAGEGAEDKRLKRALVGAQVLKAQSEAAGDKALNDAFAKAGATPAATASPAASVVPQGAGPSTPNNTGNLIAGPGAGFQTFATPEAGVAAAIKNVRRYSTDYNNGQPMSLTQIANIWAPKDDGKTPLLKGNNPAAWATNVANVMGVDPNTPIDFSNPAMGQAFAKGVHIAEHPPGSAYAPDVYQRGTDLAYNGGTGGGQATAAPVQLAQANGPAPIPQAPSAAPPVAGNAPAAPQPAQTKTLDQVIQSMPPGIRQLAPAMDRKAKIELLTKYADPETRVVIDSRLPPGQNIVFAPKNDNSPWYLPIDATKIQIEQQKLAVEQQNAESQRRQAASRELQAKSKNLNEPITVDENGQPVPNAALPAAKAAITGAEAAAKVAPALVQHQGEMVIKDHQTAQLAAEHGRIGIANMTRLGTLLDQVNTNKFQGTVQDLKASAKASGVDLDAMGVGDNVGVAQAAKALSQQLALQLRDPSGGGGMPGSLSDADRQFLTTMVPAITNDPNANKLMIDWQKKVYQRQVEVGKIVNDFVRSPDFVKDPAGVYAKVREYADKNPLFNPEKDGPKATAAPKVRRFNPETGALE